MPLAMRNLAIAQQRQKERYSLVRGGEWAKPKASFSVGDYVMIKRETRNALQAPAHPHVLRIVELRASGVVILEGSDAARCTKQMKDVAHCPLPILDTTLHPVATSGARRRSANNAVYLMIGRTWCFVTGANKHTICIA